MSRTINGWPITTLAGITCAVLLGVGVSMIHRAANCLLGYDEVCQHADTLIRDGFGPDGYGP